MTSADPHLFAGPPPAVPPQDELDPANRSLADALRKSFRILKLLMLVLVVLYFFSGWFSVRPNEAGVILRCGRIVGTGPGEVGRDPVLGPGWHWSWPYPIERWETVSTSERELPVDFLFQLSEEEQTGGIRGYKYNTLSPLRDDYLITGDVNILHASLLIKYRITDVVAYLTHVYPTPAPGATTRSSPHLRAPEHGLLTGIVRDAVIDAAARREALDIRGSGQSDFLLAVATRINHRLRALAAAGTPPGIAVDPAGGVLAPKKSAIEGILPPRQTQEAFEQVDKAQAGKIVAITKAASDAQELLLRTAGPAWEELAGAIEEEYNAMRRLASVGPAGVASGQGDSPAAGEFAARRRRTEALLSRATGDVQNILRQAGIRRDRIVKDAAADQARFLALYPEYALNRDIFLSRLSVETYANALNNERIAKMFVPEKGGRIWLQIPRSGRPPPTDQEKKETEKPGVIKDSSGTGPTLILK
jgi:membrane protease subunit HflK